MMKPSSEQLGLYRTLSEFAIDTTMSMLSLAYKRFGHETYRSPMLPIILSNFVEEYFNQCAVLIYTRKDEQINVYFDKMIGAAGKLHEPFGNRHYDPIDLLQLALRLCMQMLIKVSRAEASANYGEAMGAAKAELTKLAESYKHVAATFKGCDCDEPHVPIMAPPAEKIFTVTFDKTVVDANGIKIDDDWLSQN